MLVSILLALAALLSPAAAPSPVKPARAAEVRSNLFLFPAGGAAALLLAGLV